MDHRTLLLTVVSAVGLAASGGFANGSRAETIATENGIAVMSTNVATPTRGMTMDQVATRWGSPVTKIPAVGKPPISRWEYPGFVVYFEYQHVIHSVVANS